MTDLEEALEAGERAHARLDRILARIKIDMHEAEKAGPVDEGTAFIIRMTAWRDVS